MIYKLLVGGLEHEFYDFPYIGNVIIPTDQIIFFRGVGIPPTSNPNLTNDYKNDYEHLTNDYNRPPYCNLLLKNTWPWKIAHVDFSVPIFQELGFSRSNWQLSRFHLSSWIPSFFHSWELPLPSSWVWLGVAIEINVNVRSIGEETAGSCECRWSLVTCGWVKTPQKKPQILCLKTGFIQPIGEG